MIKVRIGKKMKGAAVVILNENNELLLLKRSMKSGWMPGKWGLPGGKLESGETTEDAAIRETKEETGLTVRDLKYLPNFSTNKADLYAAGSYTGNVVIDFEHDAFKWLSRQEVDSYDTTPEITGLFDWVLKNG